MSIQSCVLCIPKGVLWHILGFPNVYFACIRMTILHVYSNIIINTNGLDIMVTVGAYFEYIKIYITYLLNVL